MRLWWGHPAVEQIIFWALWNEVAARNLLESGLWDDAGVLTLQGEAVVSLLNDRWRTRETVTADAAGIVTLRATLGDYVVGRRGLPGARRVPRRSWPRRGRGGRRGAAEMTVGRGPGHPRAARGWPE